MKMSDVFDLPLQAAVDELAIIDNNDVVVGWVDDFHGESARDYFIESINSHDRLTEENAKLREFVEKVYELDIETLYFETKGGDSDYIDYVCTDIVNDAVDLLAKLNQLKDQTNDK